MTKQKTKNNTATAVIIEQVPVKKEYIAEQLGITIRTLNRMIAKDSITLNHLYKLKEINNKLGKNLHIPI